MFRSIHKSYHKFIDFFSNDIAIDLGTANTLVFVRGQGIVIREPSVVAVQQLSRGNLKVLAVGEKAKAMLGKTPGNIQAIRPMRDGVIANFDVTAEMIKYFIRKVNKNSFFKFKPRVVIGVPSGITQVERRAVIESAESAGVREVHLVEEAMAAAIGSGMPIEKANGNMIVDIGGGTTEVAVISLSGIVYSSSSRVGGDSMDDAIVQYIKKRYNLFVGERTAEQIKIEIGSAVPLEEEKVMDIKGRDLLTGIPRTLTITSEEIRESLKDVNNEIIRATKEAIECTHPELLADLVESGVGMAGGGSKLRGLDQLLSEEIGIPVFLAEDPLSCVALGVGAIVQNITLLKTGNLD